METVRNNEEVRDNPLFKQAQQSNPVPREITHTHESIKKDLDAERQTETPPNRKVETDENISNEESKLNSDEWLVKEMIQKLDIMLSYFWKVHLNVRDLDLSSESNVKSEMSSEGNDATIENEEPEKETTWSSIEFHIFSPGNKRMNFVQYYYIGKVISYLQCESLSIQEINEEEEEELREAAILNKRTVDIGTKNTNLNGNITNYDHDNSSNNIEASNSQNNVNEHDWQGLEVDSKEKLEVPIEIVENIWRKYDKKRKSRATELQLRDLKLFLVIRKYLIEGLIQLDAPPEPLNIESPPEADIEEMKEDRKKNFNPDTDFEETIEDVFKSELRRYNKAGSKIALNFIGIVHKYIINLRYAGPTSLQMFLQTVLIPLLSRASTDVTTSITEAKITYIIINYILECIPKFQYYVLEFVTNHLFQILPDAVSFQVLDQLFYESIFKRTSYNFLKEYIAKVIRTHKHLYLQKHLYMQLGAAIKAFDIDEERQRRKLEPYFDANRIILSRNLISSQNIGTQSKESFLLVYHILDEGRKQFESSCNLLALRNSVELVTRFIKNRKIPKKYKIDLLTRSQGLVLSSAEAEFVIQEFIMYYLEIFIDYILLHSSETRNLLYLINTSVKLYNCLYIHLASADAWLYYHRNFLLKLLSTLFHEETFANQPLSKNLLRFRIKIATYITCTIFRTVPSMQFFVALCHRRAYREEFLQPIVDYLLYLVEIYETEPEGQYVGEIFQSAILMIVQFSIKSICNTSTVVHSRTGKLNDLLASILEVACAVDEVVELVPVARQALLFLIKQINKLGDSCISEENRKLLKSIIGSDS